jgi:hypothetical protein
MDGVEVPKSSFSALLATVPVAILNQIAAHLEDMGKSRSWGGIDIALNMADGRVKSADITRRYHVRADGEKS